jgi:hypothetical protein
MNKLLRHTRLGQLCPDKQFLLLPRANNFFDSANLISLKSDLYAMWMVGRFRQNIFNDAASRLPAVLILLQYHLDDESRLYILPFFAVHIY